MILFTANPDGSEAVIVQLHRTISPIPPSECAEIAGQYEQSHGEATWQPNP